MRRTLAELLYADEELPALRRTRDPVLPVPISDSARHKKAAHHNATGMAVQSWRSLLQALATLSRNTCQMKGSAKGPEFVIETDANALQTRAFELLARVQYEASVK